MTEESVFPPAADTHHLRLRLADHVRLQAEDEAPNGGASSLYLENGAQVHLNRYAARILALCDGRTASDALARQIVRQPDADRECEEILAFLHAARQKGWLIPV